MSAYDIQELTVPLLDRWGSPQLSVGDGGLINVTFANITWTGLVPEWDPDYPQNGYYAVVIDFVGTKYRINFTALPLMKRDIRDIAIRSLL
jgi:hypothetical protein